MLQDAESFPVSISSATQRQLERERLRERERERERERYSSFSIYYASLIAEIASVGAVFMYRCDFRANQRSVMHARFSGQGLPALATAPGVPFFAPPHRTTGMHHQSLSSPLPRYKQAAEARAK